MKQFEADLQLLLVSLEDGLLNTPAAKTRTDQASSRCQPVEEVLPVISLAVQANPEMPEDVVCPG